MPRRNTEHMSNRIRGDELQHAIWKPNADIASPEVDESEGILVFTITGKEDGCIDEYGNANKEGFPALLDGEDKQGNAIHAEDMDHAYAKSIRANGKINYYVKRHSTGRLFDPTSLYSEHKQSRELHVRSEMNKWSPVDYKTFTHYLKFLSTRNAAWLRTAQRELI